MISQKKILFLLHIPPPVHGSSIVGQNIKNSVLLNETFDCRYINLIASRKIKETGKISIIKIVRFIWVFTQLLWELLMHRPNIGYLALTATGAAFYKDVLLIALLRLFRIKRVYHLHNKGFSKYQSKINKILYQFVFYDADVVLLSKYLYPDIQEYVPESRVHICPNGIADIVSDNKPHFLKNGDPVKILFLSNMIESKGVFVLLDACSILKKRGASFQCVFIGGEGNVTAFQFNEKVMQIDLSDHVRYIGEKYMEEKEQVFLNADIFAFPTYYCNECFPLVLLEAMSAGMPIVSTFEGGIPDIIEDGVTGFLVPQRNAELLADKLEVLIRNPLLREKMGRMGRKKYEEQFTLEHFEKNLIAILQKLTV